MYDSFIDIWEGSPMWGQHIEDWKTSEEQNDDHPTAGLSSWRITAGWITSVLDAITSAIWTTM